jgi:hypothetical protein
MSYVASDPESYKGQAVGDGQCVAYIKEAADAPVTSKWAEGVKVKGGDIPTGSAIATFQGGKYQNDTGGKSHAAIYVSQDDTGLLVWDQWKGQPVHQRTITFANGAKPPKNDGDAFSVIETASLFRQILNLFQGLFSR